MAAVMDDKKIVIDEEQKLVFSTEEELYGHFRADIDLLEKELFEFVSTKDIKSSAHSKYESNLDDLLEDPDEVWEDSNKLSDGAPFIFIKNIKDDLHHIAITYLTEDVPSFIYLHFPTKDLELVEKYRRGDMVYHVKMKDAPLGALDGDALLDGDPFARGLYEAMLIVRSEQDLMEPDFLNYADLREETIEDADEIWRITDSLGNTLVYFIKEYTELSVFYIVATVEDQPSNSHALLFSFPTKEESLVERYRQGENLQAEEVVQESSH